MSKYETHWKDFSSPLFRNEIWVNFGYFWPKLFKLPFACFGIRSERNNIAYFGDKPAYERVQAVLFKRIIERPDYLQDLIILAEKWGREINHFTELVHQADLRTWPAAKLIAAYKKFVALQARQYALGITLVALDVSFGPFSLDELIKKILSKKLKGKQYNEAYSAFTTPQRDSFAREQERELLKIYQQGGKGRSLVRHAEKWAWIYYVYAGPAWEEKDFAEVLKDWAKRGVKSKSLLAQWEKEREKVRRTQEKYLKILRLSKSEEKVLSLAGLVVWAKPRRKDYQSKSYWHMEEWFREFARRLNISLREARSLPQEALYQSLKSSRLALEPKAIQKLYDFHVIIAGKDKAKILSGVKAINFAKKIKEEKVKARGRVFFGSPACFGRASGAVKIINSAEEMNKMKEGDILVSVATTPSIVPAMRKAAAILTDEGGLTCHAAIVSRELKIPCVIGFKIITKALKDGDRVEVDATRGVVRKI